MQRKYTILLIGLAAVFVVVVGVVVLLNLRSKPGTENPGGNLPQYVLSAGEEQQVKEFVKTFASLYNTYEYGDVSNITALGDYQTVGLQQRSLGLADTLQSSLPEGYQKTTEINIDSFSYEYPDAETLTVTVQGTVNETAAQGAGSDQYPVRVSATLQKAQNVWRFDSISYTKTNN